ncbi:hypothetical protein B0T26DRAFT_778929 [Lasiosphaeria miniovina]|uniref:Uncharacterized protein n=1 Tax=Lasiosphaeria miniovina TaxID=1954250 RepID=A0AA40DW66_9PEZI|nr:uncharacterized protein B0T26DRAFT_778929 [Lasiosphaeria miniovina]KAK0718594.1 hypothetical protein B0T26DRAFT_778929 [Lasiosphaeria miniovina]
MALGHKYLASPSLFWRAPILSAAKTSRQVGSYRTWPTKYRNSPLRFALRATNSTNQHNLPVFTGKDAIMCRKIHEMNKDCGEEVKKEQKGRMKVYMIIFGLTTSPAKRHIMCGRLCVVISDKDDPKDIRRARFRGYGEGDTGKANQVRQRIRQISTNNDGMQACLLILFMLGQLRRRSRVIRPRNIEPKATPYRGDSVVLPLPLLLLLLLLRGVTRDMDQLYRRKIITPSRNTELEVMPHGGALLLLLLLLLNGVTREVNQVYRRVSNFPARDEGGGQVCLHLLMLKQLNRRNMVIPPSKKELKATPN